MINKFILLGLLALITSVLFVGAFEDDEFSELGIFTKHKPTTQFFFHSPTGMSDMSIESLPLEFQKDEIAFEEFVIKTGVQYPGNKYDLIPYLLIQLTLTFLALGIYRFKFKKPFEKFILPLHFIVNFLISSFVIGGILFISNPYGQIGLVLLVLVANYISIFWIRNQKLFNPSKKV